MAKKNKNTLPLTDVGNVIDALLIDTKTECALLKKWEQAKGEIQPAYAEVIENARKKLLENRGRWNEEELKMRFVSLVMEASQLDVTDKIHTFYERPMVGTLQGYDFSIICDCMVATPTHGGKPAKPYFFLQEFKRKKGDMHDPEAQMLVAMLLAQQENQDGKPIYGAWLQGENWSFTVVEGNQYCASQNYTATKTAELKQIVYMLQYLKNIILER